MRFEDDEEVRDIKHKLKMTGIATGAVVGFIIVLAIIVAVT